MKRLGLSFSKQNKRNECSMANTSTCAIGGGLDGEGECEDDFDGDADVLAGDDADDAAPSAPSVLRTREVGYTRQHLRASPGVIE